MIAGKILSVRTSTGLRCMQQRLQMLLLLSLACLLVTTEAVGIEFVSTSVIMRLTAAPSRRMGTSAYSAGGAVATGRVPAVTLP